MFVNHHSWNVLFEHQYPEEEEFIVTLIKNFKILNFIYVHYFNPNNVLKFNIIKMKYKYYTTVWIYKKLKYMLYIYFKKLLAYNCINHINYYLMVTVKTTTTKTTKIIIHLWK